jgi:hypothetical protein
MITSFAYDWDVAGAPDSLFDHPILEYRQEFHSGIVAAQVQSATGNCIMIAGPSPSGSFANGALAGRILSLIGRYPAVWPLTDVPYVNLAITGNVSVSGTYTEIYVGGASLPDVSTIFNVGDLVTVRMQVQSTNVGVNLIQVAPMEGSGTGYQQIFCYTFDPLTAMNVGDPFTISGCSGTATVMNGIWPILGLNPAGNSGAQSFIQLSVSPTGGMYLPLATTPSMGAVGSYATAHSSCFTDSLLSNPFGTQGLLTAEEATGRFAWVIDGTDAGDIQQIASISNNGTTVNLANTWTVNPDETSVIVIVGPAAYAALQSFRNKNSYSGIIGSIPVPNLGSSAPVWVLRVLSADSAGAYTDTPQVRLREMYFYGAQGSREVIKSDTLRVTDGTLLFNTANIPQGSATLNGAIGSTDTSLTLHTTSWVIQPGSYITVGSETMYVTAASGMTLSVTRASGTSHPDGTAVALPGGLVFTLLPIADVPNQGVIFQKISSDINYVQILAVGTDELPEGATYIILADTSSSLGTFYLKGIVAS